MKNPGFPVPFGSGDRLTDFRLTDQHGLPFSLSGGARGRATFLRFCEDDGTGIIDQLVSRESAFDAAGLDIILITTSSPELNAAAARRAGAGYPILSDPDVGVYQAFLSRAEDRLHKPVGCLMDPNQRVISVIGGNRSLDDLPDLLVAAGNLEQPPPVLFIPRVLDADHRRELVDLWQSHNEVIGYSLADGDAADPDAKSSRDHVVRDPQVNRKLVNIVSRRILPELRRAFSLQDTLDFEVFVILGYDAGRRDFFGPHRDNDGDRMAHRRIAISINLNDDYEGGELQFPEYSLRGYRFPAGMAAVFGCGLLHQALPPTAGSRLVLTTFLCDRADARNRQEET